MNKPSVSSVGNRLIFLGICLFCGSCGAHKTTPVNMSVPTNNAPLIAPETIVNTDIILQIEQAVTKFPNGYPFKGAVVMHYKKDGSFDAQGTGTMEGNVDSSKQAYHGTYQYRRTGSNTAIENAIDTSLNDTPYTTKYTFETATTGKWEQDFGNGQIIFSGSFTLIPDNVPAGEHLAPDTNAGLHVALIIKSATSTKLAADIYPTNGLVLQTYSPDGTLVFEGFGPKVLNSHGTYKYTKISANTAVEEVTQTSNLFVLPYTMVYTFETPNSGKWFQNLGNGLIKFSGTFDTFPSK